ncbi:MAG: response regulator [Bacilli bacterium]|nr:response regulator [Bacilli bacterium]MBR3048952.1 response regulator [Bacilli bacterium]
MMDISFLKDNGVNVDKSLELFGDMNTYNSTVGDFLVGASEKVPKLIKYKNDKDLSNYSIYAHSIKADARYFGFTKLEEIAFNHEQKSKEGDLYFIQSDFDNLINEVDRMTKVVKEYLEEDSKEDEKEEEKSESTGVVYDNKTILVVDDSNIIRNFVSRIFKDEYTVGVAKDGQEAIDIIEANKDNDQIKAILLDLNMPKVDGFAVLEHMKEKDLFTKIPVSIISGDSSKETIDKAFKYGIVDMLGKPFNDKDVKRVVERTIQFNTMDA